MQIRGYEVLTKLGEGPCGTVWKAKQLSMDRVVALKVMAPTYALDPAALERFNSDGLRAAKLIHRNLTLIHDRGDAGGAPYVASEFVDGQVLSAIIARKGRLPEQQALAVAESVAHALKYAWDRGQIFHGAVKPGNIIADRDGIVKVSDLGTAQILKRDAGHLSSLAAGLANYASPEQASGAMLLDYRSDIYSLGATLYHMVTGVLPFTGGNCAEIMDKHLSGNLADPRDLNPLLSAPLVALLEKMMIRNRGDRYASWTEVIEDMELAIHEKMPHLPLAEPGQSVILRSVSRSLAPSPANTPVAAPAFVPPPAPLPLPTPVQAPTTSAPVVAKAPMPALSTTMSAPLVLQDLAAPAPTSAPEPPQKSSAGLIAGVAIVAGLVVAGYWAATQHFTPGQPSFLEKLQGTVAPTHDEGAGNTSHETTGTEKTPGETANGEATEPEHPPRQRPTETPKPAPVVRNKAFDEHPIWEDLVAYIGFDEFNGAQKLGDTTAGGHDGFFRNGVILGLTGQIGKAADFDRPSGGRVILANALNLDANTATFTMWVKGRATKSPRSGLLFWNGETASSGIFLNGRNELRYTWNSDDETSDWNSGFTLPDDTWTFIALVVEPAKATFYMAAAGQPLQSSVNKTPHAPSAFNTPLVLGNDPKTDRFFAGRLDEVAIWKRALAQSEIETLFRAESNGAFPAAAVVETPPPRPTVVPTPNIPPAVRPPVVTPKPKPAAWHDPDYDRAVALYNGSVTTFQKYLATRDNPPVLRKIATDLDTAVGLLEKVKKTAPPEKDIQHVIDLCNKLTFDVHGTMQISN